MWLLSLFILRNRYTKGEHLSVVEATRALKGAPSPSCGTGDVFGGDGIKQRLEEQCSELWWAWAEGVGGIGQISFVIWNLSSSLSSF